MLPDPFTTEDGDVILRVGPDDTFRVHKLVLSLASSVFKDLFRTAQPDRGENGLPTIPITDPPESVDLLLRFIYPGVAPPLITDPATLSNLLIIADKYGVPTILPAVKERLADEEVLKKDPFGVYIVARRWGLPHLARRAARGLTLPKVMASPSSKDPQNFVGDDFFRLVWFMKKRDEEGKLTIRGEIPCHHDAYGDEGGAFLEQLLERVSEEFEVNPCFDTERMVKIFVDGPDPPQFELGGGYGEDYGGFATAGYTQQTDSEITKTLYGLASRLNYSCSEYLEEAMDDEFPA